MGVQLAVGLKELPLRDIEGLLSQWRAEGESYRATASSVPASRVRKDIGRILRTEGGVRGLITVKDVFAVEGVATTYGSRYPSAQALRDHPVVELARSRGYLVLGTSTVPEYGALPVTESDRYGAAKNPLAEERAVGGSSGGAAVHVALGLADIAIGSDAAGSVRIPAATVGITGFKPSPGVLPFDASSVSERCGIHVPGLLARTLAEAEASFQALALPGKHQDLRISVCVPRSHLFGGAGEGNIEEMEEGIRRAGFSVGPFPDLPAPAKRDIGLVWKWLSTATAHAHCCEAHIAEWKKEVEQVPLREREAALRRLLSFGDRYESALGGSFVLHETLGIPVPVRGWREAHPDPAELFDAGFTLSPYGMFANLLRRPAISFPVERFREGSIPGHLTLVGPRGSDGALFTIGRTLESAFGTVIPGERASRDWRSAFTAP